MQADWYAYAAHCHVQGASQSGKSKFCEDCIREHILAGNPVCLVDWHGTMYDSLVAWLAYGQPNRPIVLLNPSRSDYIVPFNPFALTPGTNISAHVNRNASLLVKPWGAENTNELPTYERIVKMVFTAMAYTGEPLHHAAQLLDYPKKELREWAIAQIEPEYAKNQWKVLQYTHSLKEWESKVFSTQNRLGRFLSSDSIVRFMGMNKPGLSIADAVQQKAIVLVNLCESDHLDAESGKVFAALLLSEFFLAAKRTMGDPQPYFLYLDECQNYLTPDAAPMLDQTLKSGLRLTLIHHDMGQFHGNVPLQSSIRTNARIKVTFAGEDLDQAKRMAEEYFLSEANERWCKEKRIRYVTDHYEDSTYTTSESNGEIPGGSTHSETTTIGSRLVPFQRKEEDGQEDWGRDEKIPKLAARFMSLKKGECYIKTPDDVYRYTVPWLEDYRRLLNPVRILEYKQSLLTNATPAHEADQLIREAEARFLARGHEYASTGKARPKKKRPLSPQQ